MKPIKLTINGKAHETAFIPTRAYYELTAVIDRLAGEDEKRKYTDEERASIVGALFGLDAATVLDASDPVEFEIAYARVQAELTRIMKRMHDEFEKLLKNDVAPD